MQHNTLNIHTNQYTHTHTKMQHINICKHKHTNSRFEEASLFKTNMKDFSLKMLCVAMETVPKDGHHRGGRGPSGDAVHVRL